MISCPYKIWIRSAWKTLITATTLGHPWLAPISIIYNKNAWLAIFSLNQHANPPLGTWQRPYTTPAEKILSHWTLIGPNRLSPSWPLYPGTPKTTSSSVSPNPSTHKTAPHFTYLKPRKKHIPTPVSVSHAVDLANHSSNRLNASKCDFHTLESALASSWMAHSGEPLSFSTWSVVVAAVRL